MQIAHRKLNNLVVIIDRNRLQIDGSTENIMSLDSLSDKLKAFNLKVIEIDGHDYNAIYEAIEAAKKSETPAVIIANTIKGKGVSFMENNAGWHGKAPKKEEYELAIQELK
jgi:transketolase